MEEIWKDIKGFEGRYQISTLGRVKSLQRTVKAGKGTRIIDECILVPHYFLNGYQRVSLRKHPKRYWYNVHRLVAESFIANPNNYKIVNHIDSNPSNNRIDNLEWCTQSYNVIHSYKSGKAKATAGCFKKGSIPHNRRKVNQYTKDKQFIRSYISIREASNLTNINEGAIQNCLLKITKSSGGFIWEYAD